MIFVETPTFTRLVTSLVPEDDYRKFQQELAEDPEQGDLIEGTGGLRKVRIALPGRGKRGGGRVIYYYRASASRILLLLVYSKNVQDTLTTEQKRTLRTVVENWK